MVEGGEEQEATLRSPRMRIESSLLCGSGPPIAHTTGARRVTADGGLACSRHASCFVTLFTRAAVVLQTLLACLSGLQGLCVYVEDGTDADETYFTSTALVSCLFMRLRLSD